MLHHIIIDVSGNKTIIDAQKVNQYYKGSIPMTRLQVSTQCGKTELFRTSVIFLLQGIKIA